MAGVSSDAVKELREQTGISVMECKKALTQAKGDMQKALELLRARATSLAAKKSQRSFGAGIVASYVHQGATVGAMILLSCETDFVAKNEEFMALGREIAMHAAAMRPADTSELLTQPYIKDAEKTIADLISGAVQKFGERIEVVKMEVFSVR